MNGQIDRSSTPTAAHPAHRGSICLEEGRVLGQHAFQGEQYVLRIEAPRCAARAQPGSFVHLTVDDDIPMRRPLSIMRAPPEQLTITSGRSWSVACSMMRVSFSPITLPIEPARGISTDID